MPKNSPKTSTVGRGASVKHSGPLDVRSWRDRWIDIRCADALDCYPEWPSPTTIVSDGGYGVLGFEGDTSDHMELPEWYEPHISRWSAASTPLTTLWFWNSEIGWAAVHPVLERHGWRYVGCNIWNKGKSHIAGNINTAKIRRFPPVTEICAHYVRKAEIDGLELKDWLVREWRRTGLPFRKANEACGVADAATRKYLTTGHLWYFPPSTAFAGMAAYANEHGDPAGRPYFSIDGRHPMTEAEWANMRAKFKCPYGVTNVWDRFALRNEERVKPGAGRKSLHLNQKPLDLMRLIIEASSDPGDVVWEPFGGLFSASFAARELGRKGFGAEIDETYFYYGHRRVAASRQRQLDGLALSEDPV